MSRFTSGELEIMQVLWDHGPLKPAQIQHHFPREIGNAALRSALLVLLDKGHVRRERRGKAYFYSALTPREGTLRSMARRMADTFTGGSTPGLIARLIEQERLSPDDVRQLKRIIDGKLKEEEPPASRRKGGRS